MNELELYRLTENANGQFRAHGEPSNNEKVNANFDCVKARLVAAEADNKRLTAKVAALEKSVAQLVKASEAQKADA